MTMSAHYNENWPDDISKSIDNVSLDVTKPATRVHNEEECESTEHKAIDASIIATTEVDDIVLLSSETVINKFKPYIDSCTISQLPLHPHSTGNSDTDLILVSNNSADHEITRQSYSNPGNFVTHEEIVTDEQWVESCSQEIVIGGEEAVANEGNANITDDFEIPLPTDQDEYTASRPYPCDFCSRRFRKKANLINHMVAHQTDRPHGCNLCGMRYVRKCDLMNHLKSHAYIPENTEQQIDEEQQRILAELEMVEDVTQTASTVASINKSRKIKRSLGAEGLSKSNLQPYNYVEEDIKLMRDAETNNVSLSRFEITDPRKPFVCQHCGVGFAREKALESHIKIHLGDDCPFECQHCNEMFWDATSLSDHVREKHCTTDVYQEDDEDIDDIRDADYSDGDDVEDEDEDIDNELTVNDLKYGTFYCGTCGLSFHLQENLRRHQRVHIKEEFVNDHEFGHICNVCGESFPEALDLLAHAEIHARGSSRYCMICGESFGDEQRLAVHVQSKHGSNLLPNTCLLCGKACKDRRTLLKHSWEHSKERSFACSKCAKTFFNKARLKRHMLSHRSKQVACDICNEEFPDGRSLMNHRHSHSNVSGRQFMCRECGKTFGSRSSQQIHIRIHTGERPYGCRFCWKAFADGGTLRKHERIHTGEKPYGCVVCPRAFNQRVVLREHIRSHHSGPDPKYSQSMTPYCCSVCSDMFATSQDLIIHLIHHCDLNTAMKRQPQIGPRKYKRRRKLKPHELELISRKLTDDSLEDCEDQIDEQMYKSNLPNESIPRKRSRKPNTNLSTGNVERSVTINDTYSDLFNSCSSAIDSINSIVNSSSKKNNNALSCTRKSSSSSKLCGFKDAAFPSRPKMIHTQKTRVAIEMGEDGRVRHKTKTLVTRTQPAEIRSATGERIRPRTKNVSYHIFGDEKFSVATFPTQDFGESEAAVGSILKHELKTEYDEGLNDNDESENNAISQSKDSFEEDMFQLPVTTVKLNPNHIKAGSIQILGSGNKFVRLVKGGMIITKKKDDAMLRVDSVPKLNQNIQPKELETDTDPSALHELAELSIQHAQNIFKCEMCSAVFSDKSKLLDHVPIHI